MILTGQHRNDWRAFHETTSININTKSLSINPAKNALKRLSIKHVVNVDALAQMMMFRWSQPDPWPRKQQQQKHERGRFTFMNDAMMEINRQETESCDTKLTQFHEPHVTSRDLIMNRLCLCSDDDFMCHISHCFDEVDWNRTVDDGGNGDKKKEMFWLYLNDILRHFAT